MKRKDDETRNRLNIDVEDSGRSGRLVQERRRKFEAEDANHKGVTEEEVAI